MAKIEDFHRIHVLRRLRQGLHLFDFQARELDRNRLCPTCQHPIQDRPGTPQAHYGELFCSPCASAMKHGETPQA